MTVEATPRPMCRRCRRPEVVCYCAHLPELATRTRVVILQHPRERDMPIGTARMASLCLPNAELHVGIDWSAHPALGAALADPTRTPILLYPGPGARDILREPPTGPVTLVVVDGTWSQAKTVVRDNPILHALPRYAFVAPEVSEYRIRREPDDAFCSTIEALMHALGALEGDRARFRAMLAPFRAMVDAQLARKAAEPSPRVKTARPPTPPWARLPAEIAARWDQLVCVVGEANAWPYRGEPDHQPDELIHWIAHRPSTGATFEALAAPRGPLSPSTPYHTRLSADALAAAPSLSSLLMGHAGFVGPDDVVCAWGHHGAQLLLEAGGALPGPVLDLRAAAQRALHTKFGSLEAFAATLGPPPPPLGAGRGGARVALLAQVVRAWRAQFPATAP
ncbi:MAG: DTW domain-containing protein [Myxococcales bacterium]|nr:DTW domain-containing protein [Myxococcales bacterium]